MYYVYAIKSEVDGRVYVGLSKDVNKRLLEHNAGRTKSTKGYRQWKLVYSEEVGSRVDARIREKYLKTGSGKEWLKKYIIDNAHIPT